MEKEKTKLVITMKEPVSGFWDGGSKKIFEYEIQGEPKKDSQGEFVKIGSWEANYWFHVAKGKTDKYTLSYAKKHLLANMKRNGRLAEIESCIIA